MKHAIKLMFLISYIVVVSGCAAQQKTPEEAWTSSSKIGFKDIVYFAVSDELKKQEVDKNILVLEFLYSFADLRSEYDSRVATAYGVDEFQNAMIKKITEAESYQGKTFHSFTTVMIGKYSPADGGFPVTTTGLQWNNPQPRPHKIGSSNETTGRGSYISFLSFNKNLKLPLDKKDATSALMKNGALRNGLEMSIPVMFEFTISDCRVNQGSKNENGSTVCFADVTKASVYDTEHINGYTKPINYRTYNRKAGLGMKIPPAMDLLS